MVLLVVANDLLIIIGRVLEGAPLGRVVDVDQAEPGRIPLRPFKVVHQRPVLVPQDGDSLVDGSLELSQVFPEEADPLFVVDAAVGRDDVTIGSMPFSRSCFTRLT